MKPSENTEACSSAVASNAGLERFEQDGLITHINGQRLLKPIPFKRGEMVTISLFGEKIVIPNFEWVEF